MGQAPADPSELTIEDAIERFVRKRRTDATERTIRSYQSRLKQFRLWCDQNGIETVGQLTAWHLDEYDMSLRDGELTPASVKGNLSTLRVWLKYCESIGAIDEEVADSVDVPTLERAEEQSQERLATEDAEAALQFFRDSTRHFGTPRHALLELCWHTGARMGSIRALDLDDYHPDEQYVEFRHRPTTGTPLKNKTEAERLVGIGEHVVEALDYYVARERAQKRDENGREPLFCARQGRPSFTTLRSWCYQATQPCLWTDCPHGKRRPTCEWTERTHCSKCPSSRSPHRVRTGSITWQLNRGLELELVAKRVNAGPGVIRKHYDQAGDAEEFSERREAVETALDINPEDK